MADPRPGQLQRAEEGTSFSTPMFTQAEYALDACHEAAKQMYAERQMHQDDLADLHRQALETARSGQAQPRQEQTQAVSGLAGELRDNRLYPESAVHAGIEAAAKSGHARGYEMGRQHAAAGIPAPARAAGRVFGGRDVGMNLTGLATAPGGRCGRVVSAFDNISPYQFRPIVSDSGSLLDADLAAMPGGSDENVQ